MWWSDFRIRHINGKVCNFQRGSGGRVTQHPPPTLCWYYLIRKSATCNYFLLLTLLLRGKKVAQIHLLCSLCIYREKNILIFCCGPRRHAEIMSSPVWAQTMLSLANGMKTTTLLPHLVCFPLKSPSCPSDTEWTTTISNIWAIISLF